MKRFFQILVIDAVHANYRIAQDIDTMNFMRNQSTFWLMNVNENLLYSLKIKFFLERP